jgi:hypothetical protein
MYIQPGCFLDYVGGQYRIMKGNESSQFSLVAADGEFI